MTSTEYTPEQHDFLSRFFGPGNLLRWDDYDGGNMPAASRNLLDPLVSDFLNEQVAVLLPRVSEQQPTTVDWYAMARSARQSRALREQLAAFIGPTYTDFTGQTASLDNTDSVEQAVADSFSPFVYRLRVLDQAERNHVRVQVFMLRSLRDRGADSERSLARPVGRLLRDLEMALVVRNEESAWQCLDDLRARGRLSAHNVTFLKVRILSHFRRWTEVLALPEWQSLVAIRRPSRVTQALVNAVYSVHFAEFEHTTNVTGCVERFRELQGHFGTIFRARGYSANVTTLKAFLLRDVSASPVRHEAIDEIVTEFPASHESQEWVAALQAYAQEQHKEPAEVAPVVDPADAAREACELGDFDRAFSLLLECEPSSPVIRQLLTCSIEINTLESARKTLDFIGGSSEDVKDNALSMRVYRQIWDELTCEVFPTEATPSSSDIPSNWTEWLERVNCSETWPNAVEIARHGSAEWSTDQLATDSDSIKRFADLLTATRSPDCEAAFKNAIPELLKALLPDDVAVQEFKPAYMNLTYLLALDTAIGQDDLTALATLTEATLECALSAHAQSNEFEELLESLEAAWNHVAAPRHLDWSLTVLDTLIAFNVKQHAPVDRFFLQVVNAFRDWSRRVRLDQWILLEHLATDLGLSDALTGVLPTEDESEATTQTLTNRLAGQTVAIYTLTERIGKRAADVIKSRFNDVRVQLAHDKVGSDRLEQLSRNADVFIVNTWDAKHAATNAIRQHRAPNAITLQPTSKSAGGILRSLFSYLESESRSH